MLSRIINITDISKLSPNVCRFTLSIWAMFQFKIAKPFFKEDFEQNSERVFIKKQLQCHIWIIYIVIVLLFANDMIKSRCLLKGKRVWPTSTCGTNELAQSSKEDRLVVCAKYAKLFKNGHCHPFSKAWNVSNKLIAIIHVHIWGYAKATTLGGWKYHVTFIDVALNTYMSTWYMPWEYYLLTFGTNW